MKFNSTLKKYLQGIVRMASIALIVSGSVYANAPSTLPVFTLPDLEGKPFSTTQLAGKAVVIDFWATWCTTCKETVPKLLELHHKYQAKGLVVIGISVDKGSAEKVKKAAAKLGMVYMLLQDKENSLSKVFGFTGIPSVYVFDRSGKLQKAMPGFDPDQDPQLVLATEKAVEESKAPVMQMPVEEKIDPVSEAKTEAVPATPRSGTGAKSKKPVPAKPKKPQK